MKDKKVTNAILLSIALLLDLVGVVYAAGNIDASSKWAWGGNAGWINFNPTHGGGVTVYDDHPEGYAWAENIGWVRLEASSMAMPGGRMWAGYISKIGRAMLMGWSLVLQPRVPTCLLSLRNEN